MDLNLLTAVYKGNTSKVQALLASGADVMEKDWKGRTALMWARVYEHKDIIKLLRQAGAKW